MILRALKVTKTYPGKSDAAHVNVLKGVDLDITEGSMTAIVGSSGSGKSTLLHLIGGLDRPTSGEILFRGEHIGKYNEDQIVRFRNKEIGFVFQFHHLLPEFTALENVMIPALATRYNDSSVKPRAEELLNRFGLAERHQHRPSMLSGGEQQRVAVARALINSPSVLLADEPTGNLDEKNTAQLMQLLTELNAELGLTIVMVTHDVKLADSCNTTVEIREGIIHSTETAARKTTT